jgi:hypothetical protein
MSIRNQNWYNLQSTRRYPLDDNSTGIDDAGNLIRDDILVDCNLRFPNTYGPHAYVQGITVSPGLVTVLIGAAATFDAVNATTIAAVSFSKPVAAGVNYAVTPIVAGVSGWLTFGPGIEQNFVGRYAIAQQSLLNPRNAKIYRPLPIPSIKKLQLSAALQNVVRLSGALPVKVHYVENAGEVIDLSSGESRTVRTNVSAIVAELDLSQRTETFDPLREFLGPCAQRPESGTCPEIPIENINGISPDCNGNIEIIFEGFESLPFVDCGGVDILTDVDLPGVCATVNDPIGNPTGGGGGGGGGDDGGGEGSGLGEDQCCAPDKVVADEEALRAITLSERFIGILVRTANTNEFWTLSGADIDNWIPAPAQDDCAFPDPTVPRERGDTVYNASGSNAAPIPLTGDSTQAGVIPDIVVDQTSASTRATYPCMLLPACWDFVGCDYPGISHPIPFQSIFGSFELTTRQAPAICPCAHMLGPESPGAVQPNKENTIFQNAAQYSAHRVYTATNLAGVSLANLQNCPTDWSVGKTISVELLPDLVYGRRVGGLFLNLSTEYDASDTPVTRYIAVVYDAQNSSIRVLRYRYLSPTVEASAAFSLTPGEWCQLHVTPILNGANISLSVVAVGSRVGVTSTLNVNIPLAAYGDITGFTGVFADRSRVYFNKFAVADEYFIIIDDTGLA